MILKASPYPLPMESCSFSPKKNLDRCCMTEWEWLESHNPNSAQWRRRCLKYFDKCVSTFPEFDGEFSRRENVPAL